MKRIFVEEIMLTEKDAEVIAESLEAFEDTGEAYEELSKDAMQAGKLAKKIRNVLNS